MFNNKYLLLPAGEGGSAGVGGAVRGNFGLNEISVRAMVLLKNDRLRVEHYGLVLVI